MKFVQYPASNAVQGDVQYNPYSQRVQIYNGYAWVEMANQTDVANLESRLNFDYLRRWDVENMVRNNVKMNPDINNNFNVLTGEKVEDVIKTMLSIMIGKGMVDDVAHFKEIMDSMKVADKLTGE